MSSTGIETVTGGSENGTTVHGKENFNIHHDDSFDTVGLTKPRPAFGEKEFDRQDSTATFDRRVPEQRPRRFWVRPLVLIFVPAIVTAYYGVIWVHLVQNAVYDETVKYRSFSGSLIFYSWFMIGVFGLSWSKFGLVGLEASMVRERFWSPPNLVALLNHSNDTWSGPSGWIKAIVQRQFHLLWCLLAFLSVIPFIAFPLSGLVFEISDGYHSTSEVALVVGRNRVRFNQRYETFGGTGQYSNPIPAQMAWMAGSMPMIPGFGIVFTGESVDRSQYSDFEKLPNTLPLAESIPDLFLAPQAKHPISGKAWGLRFQYDCTVVQSVSEFTILSQKSASSIVREGFNNDGNATDRLTTPSGDIISWYSSFPLDDSIGNNVQAYVETGRSAERVIQDGTIVDGDKYGGNYPGFEEEVVLEYAMWQIRQVGALGVDIGIELDQEFDSDTTEPSIQGLGSPYVKADNGTWMVNKAFFDVKDGNTYDDHDPTKAELQYMIGPSSAGRLHEVGAPIGVRCVSSSDVGKVDLDGVTSTFSNFERSPPELQGAHLGAFRFGMTTQRVLEGQFYQHYLAGGLPGSTPSNQHEKRFAMFIDPASLLRSINLAYALEASNLMYDSRSGLNEWPNENLTATEEGKILSAASLVPGVALGNFILALFCVWAALSAGLGLVYGFRKRPSDRLDGYVMLRKGADMAGELKRNDEFMNGKSSNGNETLAALDGNVLGAKS